MEIRKFKTKKETEKAVDKDILYFVKKFKNIKIDREEVDSSIIKNRINVNIEKYEDCIDIEDIEDFTEITKSIIIIDNIIKVFLAYEWESEE